MNALDKYVYKVVINCFKVDERYETSLLCRDRADETAEWELGCIVETATLEKATECAVGWTKIYRH